MKLFTVYEVAEMLKCKPSAVRKWIRLGRLHAVHAGRLVRVREEDLTAFLRGREPGFGNV